MSHHDHDDHGAHVIKGKGGGGAGKWLAGALAAAVVLGGGYYAYRAITGRSDPSRAEQLRVR